MMKTVILKYDDEKECIDTTIYCNIIRVTDYSKSDIEKMKDFDVYIDDVDCIYKNILNGKIGLHLSCGSYVYNSNTVTIYTDNFGIMIDHL